MMPTEHDANPPAPEIAEVALDARGEERLVRFYDRLRGRVAASLRGRVGGRASDALLLAPDLFILLVRLFLDPRVPAASRSLVGGALAYFLLPADLMPEVLLGVGGFLDDVVLAGAVVSHVFSGDLRPFIERHWSGTTSAQSAIESTVRAADALLPSRLYRRLAAVLGRHGVELGAAEPPVKPSVRAPAPDDPFDYSRTA